MIEVLYGPTPNVWKITIMLEETRLPYRLTPVYLSRGDQFEPDFLAISPNNRIPAIIDHAPDGGDRPLAIFESGAILLHLAEKSGRFLPTELYARSATIQWLMWQMAGLGPMLGQHGHFQLYAEEKIPYAIDRFRGEAKRLYGVLDRQLTATGAYVAGADYTIADIACFPWIMTHKAQGLSLDDWPQVQRWFATLRARPALQRGLAAGRESYGDAPPLEGAMRRKVFGIGAGGDSRGEE
ncbi:glutathione binding-like protein [Sphingomonas immobilis]|uniref:Glutathione S-transferase N-terminal domain-containing protein n=1 Tax=Sphingomonas immobilis TaxID=3063997 RepID=A0ABT9A5L9_9SPHN|nr:glutathione binding-like protein [Sphingomonas sp. CA1-15]MDO7844042.1 glutathione S-transferase N-terminal domain-containing protein [Sphingomonas sp. CA1-15]